MSVTLILGSAPGVLAARGWAREGFARIVAINNAHAVRTDWDEAIFPHDFPPERQPVAGPGQRLVTDADFVAVQNRFGGFVYAGGTMAFTAAYWALGAHSPAVIAMAGCDMQYPASGPTHFYGRGAPDPLRADVTLRSLPAKSARLMVLAARAGTAMVNLSQGPSALVFPRAQPGRLAQCRPQPFDAAAAEAALAREAALGYHVASGRYWEEAGHFDPAEIDRLDALWLRAARPALRASA